MGTAWLISGAAGLLLGVVAGANRGKTADKVITGYALVTASTPAFWLALVLLMIFAVWLKVLPIGLSVPIGVEAAGVTVSDRIAHGILPALTLSITGLSNIIALHTRGKWPRPWKAFTCCLQRQEASPKGRVFFATVSAISYPCHDLAVCIHQRDHRRLCAGGAGIFLSGTGQAAVTAGLGGCSALLGITVISAAIVFAGNLAPMCFTASWIQESEEGGQGMKRMNRRKMTILLHGIDSDASAACSWWPGQVCMAGCHGDGFFQKESGALCSLSIWNGLDGETCLSVP